MLLVLELFIILFILINNIFIYLPIKLSTLFITHFYVFEKIKLLIGILFIQFKITYK